ncbi:MAG TPA: tetratricopeptide repeat protein, partial [Geobacteraceae bacterium]
PAAWNEANRRTGKKLSLGEASSYWFHEGLRFVASEPGKFIANDVDKVVAFFNRYEIPDNYNYYFARDSVPLLPVLFVGFGLILPLAAMGLFTVSSRERALLLVVPATSLLTAVIFYYNGRFRVTALPFLLILAVAGLFQLWEVVRERRHRRLAALLATGGGAAVVAFLPPKISDDFYFSYVTTGECVEKSAPQRAMDYYRRAIALHPQQPEAHVSLGKLRFAEGDFDAARREFMAVPDSPEALLELSVIAFARDNYPEAAACLEKALAIRPNMLSVYNRLSLLYSLMGREADAKAVMSRALAIDPAYFKEFSNVGR